MAIPRTVQRQLEKGDFHALEGDWLARVEAEPHGLDYFVGVARALVGCGEAERASFLLALLEEHLEAEGLWSARLELLRRLGDLPVAPPAEVHGKILATLERLHGDQPSFSGLADLVGLHRAVEDLPKTWAKVARLQSLLAYDLGEVVSMEGKGAGRVVEVNLELQSFKVDFESQSGLSVGFRAAPKLLTPLPPGHFLRRKLEEPASLTELRDRAPGELLGEVLTSYERPLAAGEIRQALSGIVAADSWSTWWSTARRHPQLVTHPASPPTYSWADSAEDAVAVVAARFQKADRRDRIEIFRKHANRDPGLREQMVQTLLASGEELAPRDPQAALVIWSVLEREGAEPDGAAWSPRALVRTHRSPELLAAGLADRQLRERILSLVRSEREDWPEVFERALLQEADPRLLDRLFTALREESVTRLESVVSRVLGQPRKHAPIFVWLAERAAQEAELQARPLLVWRQTLRALGWAEMASFRSRLVRLIESGGTLPRLLPLLDESQAALAREAVHKARRLEDFQRRALITALELRFPSLRDAGEAPLYATPESIAAKRSELQLLLQEEIPANRRAIEEARALGDLRENFEYKAARQRHEYLSARVAALQRDLERVRPLDPAGFDPGEVRVGCRVTLEGDDGEERGVTLLGPWESRPEANIISYESDLGRGLIGKAVGDDVTIANRRYRVRAIEPFRSPG